MRIAVKPTHWAQAHSMRQGYFAERRMSDAERRTALMFGD